MQHNKFLVMDTGGFIRGFEHLDQFYSEVCTVLFMIDVPLAYLFFAV